MEIRRIDSNDIASVQSFLFAQLAELFAQEGRGAVTGDVLGLSRSYIEPVRNRMWAAFSPDGAVIGTIAICEYNDRIEVLKGRYPQQTTAEIGRCYIDKTLRRQGIGARLLETAEAFCREQGYKIIYLHTHHFLPGGFNFWKKQGFRIVLDEGGSYELVHMEKDLSV